MNRRFTRLLREYFMWGSLFVVLLLLTAILYMLDYWLDWGLFA